MDSSSTAEDEEEALAKRRKKQGGPASLKLLVPATDLRTVQKTQLFKKVDASVWTSAKGDWYPFFVTTRPQKIVIFRGEAHEIHAAFKKLSETLEESNDGNNRTYRFLVPGVTRGLLIGTGGERIRHALDETGARIYISTTPSNEDIVVISGTSQTVTAAAKWLVDTLQEENSESYARLNTNYYPRGSSEPQTELELHIPEEKIGLLLGKGGVTFAFHRKHCFCVMELDTKTQKLKITGHLGDVEIAVRYIMQQLFAEPRTQKVSVEPE